MELPIGAWRAWQVQAIPRVLVRVSPERDGRRGSVRAQNARCAPHAGVPHPLGRERRRAARRRREGPPAVREESSAVRRTRQWETTFEDEVLSVADRIDAMLQIRSEERDSLFSRARRAQAPPTTAKPVCNQKLLLPNRLFVLEQIISVSEQISCFTSSRALAALGRRPCARPHRGLLRPRRLS